jgi:cell division protein ZapE
MDQELPKECGPLPAYRAKLQAGLLSTDPAQALAAERLQDLWRRLRGYDPPSGTGARPGLLARLFRRRRVEEMEDRIGLYLVGEVGRGKSMLMDMFFAAADVPRKQRIHFHRFMQETHARIHAWRRTGGEADPIPVLADQIAARAALLCFDEFQVNDIADALILGRLFQALFERGVAIVATSNTLPDNLFAGQPGRDAFLPFIALLKANLDILVLEAGPDHRRSRLQTMPSWYVPADDAAGRALDEAFRALSGEASAHPERLLVSGRKLSIPLAAQGVARFDFASLCGAPLGPGDYLAIATHFHAVVLDGVPRFSAEDHNEARRFITLIDALYEHRVKLVASAGAEPDMLFPEGVGAGAFQRTASRLMEMRSSDYLALPHLT